MPRKARKLRRSAASSTTLTSDRLYHCSSSRSLNIITGSNPGRPPLEASLYTGAMISRSTCQSMSFSTSISVSFLGGLARNAPKYSCWFLPERNAISLTLLFLLDFNGNLDTPIYNGKQEIGFFRGLIVYKNNYCGCFSVDIF